MKPVIYSKLIDIRRSKTVFEEQQAVNQDENILSDEDEQMNVDDTISQRLQASNILGNVYATSVILEGKLPSAEIQNDCCWYQLLKATVCF